MKVVVFRARPDGERTATMLEALGHQAVLAPVLEIVPTARSLPDDSFDALVFTSAHAVATLTARSAPTHWPILPCFCVGDRTAEVAREAGFRDIRTAEGTAASLAEVISLAFSPGSRLLLLSGPERKPTLEEALRRADRRLDVVEIYEARAVPVWPDETVEALRRSEVVVALHFSRRSAALALALSRQAGLDTHVQRWSHLCLSEDVAQPLREAGLARLGVAQRSDGTTLIAMVADSSTIERARPT